MSDRIPNAALPTVLRDVAISGEPRPLLRHGAPAPAAPRPAAPAEAKAAPVEASAPAPERPAAPKATVETALQEGHRAGFAQGRQEGFQEGLKEGRAEGLEQGLAEGREAGRQEALGRTEAAREAVAQRLERLDQLLAALPRQFSEQMAARLGAAEDEMVALCHAVICRILGDKLQGRDGVVSAVRMAIEQCCGSGTHSALAGLLSVHVHPRDLEVLQGDPELAAWLKRHGAEGAPWVPDEQVQLGGCIVRSAQGSLDARLETQLAALQDLLSKGGA